MITTSSVKCPANFFCHSVRPSMTSGVGSGVSSGTGLSAGAGVSCGAVDSAGAGELMMLVGLGGVMFFAFSRGITW